MSDLIKKVNSREEVDFLSHLCVYLSENPENIDKVLNVLGDVLEAKQIVFAYSPMSEEEAVSPEYGLFKSRIKSIVDNGISVTGMAREGTEWTVPCGLVYAIVASMVTMIRNDVMDNCSEENMELYSKFIEIMRKSALAGTEAITFSEFDKKRS